MEREADFSLLERLYASPRLAAYAEAINARMEDEARRRQAFFDQITEDDKAEFINGEVVAHSPVKLRHASVGQHLFALLSAYVNSHELGFVGFEKILVSLTRNDYEPDICFFGRDKADAFTPDQMRFPAPDLAVEVLSPSTEANDRGVKFEDYAAHSVAEYWLVDPDTETIEQYRLADDAYELVMKSKSGDLESAAVAGFVVPVRAIFDAAIHRATLAGIARAG